MSPPAPRRTLNGTYEDVASFFATTTQTVGEWKRDGKIGFWQEGRNVVFGEEHVVEYWVKHSKEARGLKPGEAADECRRKWEKHLQIRSTDEAIDGLRERVFKLETFLRDKFQIELRRKAA